MTSHVIAPSLLVLCGATFVVACAPADEPLATTLRRDEAGNRETSPKPKPASGGACDPSASRVPSQSLRPLAPPPAPSPPGGSAASGPTDEAVPAASGDLLSTKVFLPSSGQRPFAVLVERTPYFASMEDTEMGARLNGLGYAYVRQATRGIASSEGTFEPYRHDLEDGRALVEWVKGQSWADGGRIGAIGCSYSGFAAIATAAGHPDVRVVVADGPVASEASTLKGGVASLDTLHWLGLVETGDYPGESLMTTATKALDLNALDEKILGHRSEFWRAMVSDLRPVAPFWQTHGLESAWPELRAPVLVFNSGEGTVPEVLDGLMTASAGEARARHRIFVTPGEHCHPTEQFIKADGSPEAVTFETFLGAAFDGQTSASLPPAMIMVGANLFGADAYPPAATTLSWYPENAGTLGVCPIAGNAPPQIIDSDPSRDDPCASIAALEYRSEPLPAPLVVVGRPRLTVYASSDAPDFDLFAEVTTEGGVAVLSGGARARYRRGFDKAAPATMTPEPITITADESTVVEIAAGDRLVLKVSHAKCQFNLNPHSGEESARQTRRQKARIYLFADAGHPSSLELDALSP